MKQLAEQSQVDWVRATRLRDKGMQRAVEHADRVEDGWGQVAYSAVRQFLVRQPPFRSFTTEDVREWAKLKEPPDRRAWGAVMVRAVRGGLIHKVGYRPHRDPSRHKGVSTVWATGA